MHYRDEQEYRRWRRYGDARGWFERTRDQIADWFRDEDEDEDDQRENNRPYGYMYGSQTYGHHGPVERWTLGGTEFGEYGTRPASGRKHHGRGPKNYQRSDERIREDIIERLVHHHDIDASDVELEVKDGEVKLQGMVESRYEKRLAEDVCEDVFGVKNVLNFLKVRESMPISQQNELQEKQQQQQHRSAGPMSGGIAGGTTPGGTSR